VLSKIITWAFATPHLPPTRGLNPLPLGLFVFFTVGILLTAAHKGGGIIPREEEVLRQRHAAAAALAEKSPNPAPEAAVVARASASVMSNSSKDGEKETKAISNNVYIMYVIATYWMVSISMVYLNKMLLSNKEASIPAPLFVTWFQCVLTCVICIVLGRMGEETRSSGKNSFLNEFPVVKYSVPVGMSVLPLSLVFVAMITFNNLCLQYVEVSFYNVARSLSIVFNVVFTYFLLAKTTSSIVCGTLVVVIVGFIVGIDGEVNFSPLGTISGVMSSVFVSLNSIYTSKVLPKVDNDKSMLLYYNNLNASYLFLPLIALFESEVLYQNASRLLSPFFWFSMCITGCMGFAIGLVTVMQVKATSPLTHNISGTAKAAVQSLLAFYIWGNQATAKGVAGILLVIFGSGLYAWAATNAPSAPALPVVRADATPFETENKKSEARA